MELTWEQISEKENGTIVHDVFEDGVRHIIMRGPASLCAYIGVPSDHPLAGFGYDELPIIACHGGLTFARDASDEPGKTWPEGYYWYGWDYAHCNDYCFYYDMDDLKGQGHDHSKEKKWLVQDVIADSQDALYDFRQLIRLAAKIKPK